MVEMLRLPAFLLAGATLRLGLCLVAFHAQFIWCAQLIFARPAQASATAQEHADRGMQLAQSGDLKSAETELRRAVELAPRDPAFLASLGRILGMQQKLEESSAYFEKALEIDPNDPANRRNLASNQVLMGQLQSARENLDWVLKAKPTDKTALLLRGMVAEELQDYSGAIKWLESVPDQVQERPNSIAALAHSYYHMKQSQKAKQLLKSLQAGPAGAEGVFLGAQVAAGGGDYETAEELFKSIESSYPDTVKLGYQLAFAQYRNEKINKSQETLLKLIDAGRVSTDIFNLLGWCYHKQNKLKEAVAAMDDAIAREPSRESNYLDLGAILLSHKRLPVALEAAKKAVEVAPTSYAAWRFKGVVETRMNHLTEAVKTYQRAVELNPNMAEAILGLALAQSADGLTEEAAATFERGTKHFSNDPKLFQEYGRMLLNRSKGNDDATESRAVSLLERAIALDASVAEPHYQLGNLALLKERPEEALWHLQVAARLDPKSSKIHFGLRRAYSRMGRREEASKELELYNRLRAAESEPESDSPASAKRD